MNWPEAFENAAEGLTIVGLAWAAVAAYAIYAIGSKRGGKR